MTATKLSRAAEMAIALNKRNRPSWTLKVAPDRHPKLYAAIDLVSHDSGGGAGHPYHLIAPVWEPYIADIEQALSSLTGDEFETFCIGEASEVEAILARSSVLETASVLLNEWFDSEPEAHR